MPFGYFGAKHGMAKQYSPPAYSTIVEPFAGAAGYSCYHASTVDRVVLVGKNPNVVALWNRLLGMSIDDLMAIPLPVQGERTTDPLVACASGEQMMAVLAGKSRQITSRMANDFPRITRKRVARWIENSHKFEIHEGDFVDVDQWVDGPATWLVDPPYQPMDGQKPGSAGGTSYREFAFDRYDELARWCRTRPGHEIVCEQETASWLPFVPFRRQRNAVGRGTHAVRMEVVWEKNDG